MCSWCGRVGEAVTPPEVVLRWKIASALSERFTGHSVPVAPLWEQVAEYLLAKVSPKEWVEGWKAPE